MQRSFRRPPPEPSALPDDTFGELLQVVLDFLESKSLVATERALRIEVEQFLDRSNAYSAEHKGLMWSEQLPARNQRISELEKRLELIVGNLNSFDSDASQTHGYKPTVDLTPEASPAVHEPSFSASRAHRNDKIAKAPFRPAKLFDMAA